MLTSLKYELFSVELLCSSAPVGRLIVGCWLMDVGLADYGVKVLAAFDDTKPDASPPAAAAPSAVTVPALPPPITPPQLPPVIEGPTPSPATSPPAPAPTTATPSDSSPSNQYIPPSDLYQFAPNVHSHYPQLASGDVRFNGVSSYLPPPAGTSVDSPPADSNPPSSPPSNQYIPPEGLFQFPPNIHSHYHPTPPEDSFQFNGISSYLPPPAGPSDAYLPPPSDDSPPTPPPADSNDMIGTIPIGPDSPYPSYLPPSSPPQPAPSAPMVMKNPPPPMDSPPTMSKDVMAGPPQDIPFDIHDHEIYYPHDHYHHDHYSHDHYPEYIFDHDHHHHDEPPPPTTAAPPPPPPPVDAGTARVKNYSYYYLSRTLWYVPLYFTLYFCFYVLILILRSIARHKVSFGELRGIRSIILTNGRDDRCRKCSL
ncbi:AAEL013152-PA [Aedes aegypti]|uniref:AAEL013152-PA n=1 Tax=Aedes aegypti TaxID=7159 RepID=Q16K02_AEDAE|nr:AAEL013152-PA [Aedes aegypti]